MDTHVRMAHQRMVDIASKLFKRRSSNIISTNLIETETVAFDPNDIILSENIHRENEKGMFEFI